MTSQEGPWESRGYHDCEGSWGCGVELYGTAGGTAGHVSRGQGNVAGRKQRPWGACCSVCGGGGGALRPWRPPPSLLTLALWVPGDVGGHTASSEQQDGQRSPPCACPYSGLYSEREGALRASEWVWVWTFVLQRYPPPRLVEGRGWRQERTGMA